MGNGDSLVLDAQGQPSGPRHCILLVTPPSYEVSRLVSQFPKSLGYEYVSVGQMIRDEINKKTNYSQIILENLEHSHKINEKILDILLKNAALLGNFIIKFSPRDKDEYNIWEKFVGKVVVDLAVVVRAEPEELVSKRPTFKDKVKSYEKEVEWVMSLVGKDGILVIEKDQNAAQRILEKLKLRKSQH